MRLTAMIFLTLDGVYQGPGSVDEDRSGGFERGGWASQHPDPEAGAFIREVYARADALLLGRRTYDIWAPYWPAQGDGHDLARIINGVPRHVPSTTLRDPSWDGTHVIAGDVERAIRDLTAAPGRELLVQGSGVLLRWLLGRRLVDELRILLHPVVLGQGKRLFAEAGPRLDLALASSRSTSSGIEILTYRPAAAPCV